MPSDDSQRTFLAGRALLLAGDLPALTLELDRSPDLVHARISSVSAPYDGYFHGATLLHHVAGNPEISPLPARIIEAAGLLLDRGADVDSVTLQGPGQPDDIGWTTLGLVASSSAAREAGHQEALMDLLIDAGADVDARRGGCIMGALYYGESRAAEYLAARGATVDLVAAAGVGDLGALRSILEDDARMEAAVRTPPGTIPSREGPGPSGGEPRLAHYSRVPWPSNPVRQDLLALALTYAALHGRVDALRVLLEAGADPDHRPPFDSGATALHRAAMGDHPVAIHLLLEAGADPEARDLEFHSTPLGWAKYMRRSKALEALS